MNTKELQNKIWELTKEVEKATYVVIEKKDMVDENEDWREELWELPFAYIVDKHFYYVQCFVQRVENGTAYLIGLGEDMGKEYKCKIEELPVFTIIELYEQIYLVV